MKNVVLNINELSKTYYNILGEVQTLKDINFDVYENEFICIVGSSGCGKSSILNILAGLDKDYFGTITFKDSNYKIGYMLQEDSLFPWLNIYENTILGLKIQNELTEKNKKYVLKLLKKYGLGDFIKKYPGSLSGGMRQRVALIRTLATKPDILLLDEPFSALDYQSRLKVSDDVYNILKKENKTTIMVTHDIAEAISLAERVIILSKRPASVKKIYEIALSKRSNPINNRKAPEFSSYYEKIWKDLDINV